MKTTAAKTTGTKQLHHDWDLPILKGRCGSYYVVWSDGDGIPHTPRNMTETLVQGGHWQGEDSWTF